VSLRTVFRSGYNVRVEPKSFDGLVARPAGVSYSYPMVASLLTDETDTQLIADLLRPEPLVDGVEPEERFIVCGVSWKRYLALDKALGHDRPGPRFYYLDGDLEIMTTSNEHERIKTWIADFLSDYFLAQRIRIVRRGQATLRKILKRAGAEPDDSWCIGAEKKFPDLVLEIALTSGGLNKLDIYKRFNVREVWFWRGKKVELFVLGSGGEYKAVKKSELLPKLDISLLEHCLTFSDWYEARLAFRAGLGASK
jgi:Uma2 family endonuclease